MKESSRHHYIPKFYIKGFLNEKGIIYVYDKKTNKIRSREIWPKEILFDWDRNTIYNENDSSSIIEDFWYKWLDNYCSNIIETFRESDNTKGLHNIDNVSQLQIFLIHLMWRIPKFDFVFDYLFENAEKLNSNGELLQFDNDHEKDAFMKLERLKLPNKIVKEVSSQMQTGGFYSNLFDIKRDDILLGDYPMVFKVEPNSFDNIIAKELIFPISSKRLWVLSNKPVLSFDFMQATTLNAIIIEQSVRYVCSPNKDFLENSVDFYKKLFPEFSLDYLKNKVFE